MFSTVNFFVDGLGLAPPEYIELLSRRIKLRELKVDFWSTGGLVEELELYFAHLLGKESAIYLPTGTLTNQLAIRALAGINRRVLVQAESHMYNDSGDGAEILGGLKLIPLALGESTFKLSQVQEWVDRTDKGGRHNRVGVIAIENPVRRKDHQMFDLEELTRVCLYARQNDIRLHLDGARMFNLPLHSGTSVHEFAAYFDTVYVSLKKHFNAAAGAMLAGDHLIIDDLLHWRKTFGGSLPQAWPQIALVDQYVDNYEVEYARSWAMADEFIECLAADRRFQVEKVPNGTSRFLLSARVADPELFGERLRRKNVILPSVDKTTGKFRMQVNPTILRTGPIDLAQSFSEALERDV
jgi:threonine aldolase